MKTYVHARLKKIESAALEALKAATGQSESELVRRGLDLVAKEERQRRSALELAGASAGRFEGGSSDLSTNERHLDGFGG